MQNATNFFLFFCMSLGDVEKQWQVRLQESDTTIPPHPTPPNVDLLCMKPIYRHGIMDRPWLQRKRTDTLTTHRNLFFFLLGFVVVFFVFFLPNHTVTATNETIGFISKRLQNVFWLPSLLMSIIRIAMWCGRRERVCATLSEKWHA